MSTLLSGVGFGLLTAALLALAAVGFTVQFGITNLFNLAYAQFMLVAAYVGYTLTNAGVDVWVALPIAALAVGALSVAVNRFVYMPFVSRGRALFSMVLVTVSVGLAVEYLIEVFAGAGAQQILMNPGSTWSAGGLVLTTSQIIIVVIAAIAMALFHLLLRHTRLGKAMRATSSDVSLARACGIPAARVRDVAWFISGVMCGAAGVVLGINVSFDPTTGSSYLVPIAAAAVLGGIGRPHGAMLGALVVGVGSEVFAAITTPSYKDVIAFGVLLVVMLVRPQGILPGSLRTDVVEP